MRARIILLAGASFAFTSIPVQAQGLAASEGIEDIVVTAQKREERLQSVPVSVTALSSEAIVNNRLTDFSNLTRVAPSMTITQQTSSPNNSIILRGIGTFAFSIGVEPSVAVIIDDMPVVQQAQAFDNMADVARIEVLKGPQGTLFGKNASAGVVNIVTKDPGDVLEGSASASVATDRDVRLDGVISAPLADGVGVRVTGFYRGYRGNVHNLTSDSWLNGQKAFGLRGKLKAELGDKVTFLLTGAYARTTQDGTGSTWRAILGTGTPRVQGQAALPMASYLGGITPGTDNFRARLDALGATSNETASVAGRFTIDMGFADLISVTAYQDWKYRFQNDFDSTDADVIGYLTSGALHGGIAQEGPFHSRNFTQELRLVSGGSTALKYVGGLFYSHAKTDRAFVRGPVVALADWSAVNTNQSLGIFAQVDYKLPTNTTLSGGLRYNYEKIDVAYDNHLPTATPNSCATGAPACRGQNSDNVLTWKGSIAQDLTPDVMAYASVARGYKGYAYDITTGFNPARINGALNGTAPGLLGVGPVKPETSTAWELGVKSRFLDNRVQLNVVGFLANYNNFQAQSAILYGNPPAPQFVLNNVGKLRTKGIEIELSAKPAPWLRIDSGAAYTDAMMLSFPSAQGYNGQTGQIWNGASSALVGPCVAAAAATATNPRTTCTFQDRSGNALPNSPKFKWNVGATADFPIGADIKGTAVLSYQHQSSVNFDLLGNPLLVQDGYGVLNGSLAADFGRVRVTAFVNNLFNKHFASNLADSYGSFGGSATNDTHPINQFFSRDAQRYGGLKVGVTF